MAASSYSVYELLEEQVISRLRVFLEENSYYNHRANLTRTRLSVAWAAGKTFSGATWQSIFEDFILQSIVAYLDVFRGALQYIAFHHSTARAMDKDITKLATAAIRSGRTEDFVRVEALLSKTRQSCGLPAYDEIIELTPDRSSTIIKDIRDMTMAALRNGPPAEKRLMLMDIKRFLAPGSRFNIPATPHESPSGRGTVSLDVAVQEQTKLSSMFMGDVVLFSRKIGEVFVRDLRAGLLDRVPHPAMRLYEEMEKVLLHVLAARIYEDMMTDIVALLVDPVKLPASAGCMTTALDDRLRDIVRGEARRADRVRKRDTRSGLYYMTSR